MTSTVGASPPEVGHGTLIGGRYRLDAPVAAVLADAVREWSAEDVQDGARVRLWLARPGAAASDLIDAARRARAVTLDGLVPVRDVGSDEHRSWVVLPVPAGRTLRRLLDGQPLPPESARRIIGEAARVLARSGARGLHHTRLSTADIVVDDDGRVSVDGVGIAAVRQGLVVTGDAARRADAVGLVRALNAALTGRWHGPASLAAGLPQAPRLAGAVVGPADLVGGVPNDLDTLCRVTLGTDLDGPLSPRELAEQLAPWAERAPVATPGALDATGPSRPVTAEIARVDLRAPAATVADVREAPSVEPVAAAARPSPVTASASPTPSAPGPSAPSAAQGTTAARSVVPALGEADIPAAYRPSTSAATLWDWADNPLPTAEADSGGPVPQLPGIDPLSVAAPDERQSRAVLAIMAVLVLVGLVVGVAAVREITRDGLHLFSDDDSITLPPVAAGPRSPAPAASATAGPASVLRAIAMDPQGDGRENDDDAGRAVDSRAGSSWRSDRYRSATFGGLKDGLGLALQLSKGTVSGVVAKIDGEGGKVELRTAPGPDLQGSTVVATADVADGTATLVPARPVTGAYLLLWFTELPRVDGGYRAEVSDVRVR
ncbi:MAG: hypothetical protein U0Q15_02985 [Kineosporiaceae bacterium]